MQSLKSKRKIIVTDRYEGPDRREKLDWHLTKSVSVSMLIGILANIIIVVALFVRMQADVDTIKERPDLTERVIKLEALTSEYGRILTRLDTTIDNVNSTLERVAVEQAKRSNVIEQAKDHLRNGKH